MERKSHACGMHTSSGTIVLSSSRMSLARVKFWRAKQYFRQHPKGYLAGKTSASRGKVYPHTRRHCRAPYSSSLAPSSPSSSPSSSPAYHEHHFLQNELERGRRGTCSATAISRSCSKRALGCWRLLRARSSAKLIPHCLNIACISRTAAAQRTGISTHEHTGARSQSRVTAANART